MGNKKYDIEEGYSKILNDLRNLPKINAPDNFEFNLMTRIRNENFGNLKEEKPQFNIIKFLAPSAVVVTAFLVFFLFLMQNDNQNDNPLMSEPTEISVNAQGANQQNDIAAPGETLSKNHSDLNTGTSAEGKPNERKLNGFVHPNDVVIKPDEKYPIDRNRSIALDDYISGDTEQTTTVQRGNVVNSDQQTSDNFDGFLIRQKPDKALIAKYRAMIDSAQESQMRADSIKNARKIK